MPKPTVFLSYSRKDKAWKRRLRSHLKVLEQVGSFDVWDDRRIGVEDTWYDKIRMAVDDADAAICMISADYLSSDFCVKEEIPYLLKKREEKGMLLLPVLLRPCAWKYVPWLKAIQMLPRDGKAVAVDFARTWDVAFNEVAEAIAEWAQGGGDVGAIRSPALPPVRSDVDLPPPPPRSALFGRDAELRWLDELWEQGTVRIVSLTGPEGIGKSALANTWWERTRKEADVEARPIGVWDDAKSRPGLAARLAEHTRPGVSDRDLYIFTSRKSLARVGPIAAGDGGSQRAGTALPVSRPGSPASGRRAGHGRRARGDLAAARRAPGRPGAPGSGLSYRPFPAFSLTKPSFESFQKTSRASSEAWG